jgi:hypothetical protein
VKTLFLFLSLSFSTLNVLAEPIYKSESKSGIPVYSSKSSSNQAEIAKLPTLKTETADTNTEKQELISCSSHGGINCSLGKDIDGSVICYDGFRDSQQRYVFSCSRAKLEILEASLTSDASSSSFIVRNLSNVTAKVLSVSLRNSLVIKGPEQLDGYDSIEIKVEGVLKNLSGISVSCENC